jgi:hypothetical protein
MSRTRISSGSFLLAFIGAALLILGTMLSWVSIQLAGDVRNAVTPSWLGVDLPEGLAVLALGVLSIAGILVMGSGRLAAWRTRVILALGVAAVAAFVITIVDAAGALGRFRDQGLTKYADALSKIEHQPVDLVLAHLRAMSSRLASVNVGSGVWISLAGAVVLGAGVLLALKPSPSTEPSSEVAEAA